jgi:hypothetical protein
MKDHKERTTKGRTTKGRTTQNRTTKDRTTKDTKDTKKAHKEDTKRSPAKEGTVG